MRMFALALVLIAGSAFAAADFFHSRLKATQASMEGVWVSDSGMISARLELGRDGNALLALTADAGIQTYRLKTTDPLDHAQILFTSTPMGDAAPADVRVLTFADRMQLMIIEDGRQKNLWLALEANSAAQAAQLKEVLASMR